MDLTNVPKHAWWIITLTILMPLGFLIVVFGILLITYSSMLPKAKGVAIDTPYVKIISEFASQQIAINDDVQKIITETSNSINTLMGTSVSESNLQFKDNRHALVRDNAELISNITAQASLLKDKKKQLEMINNILLQMKGKVQDLQSK